MYGLILFATLAALLITATISLSNSMSTMAQNITTNATDTVAQTFTREPYSETVANSPFTIYAGKNTQFSFTVPSDAVNAYLRGDMSISGGIVPVLDLIVSDSTGNTHSRSTFNGYGNVNMLLPPGLTYYLTVRNGAILANDDKVVSPNFVVYYDRLIPTGSNPSAQIGGNMSIPPCTETGVNSGIGSVINESHVDPATGQTVLDCVNP